MPAHPASMHTLSLRTYAHDALGERLSISVMFCVVVHSDAPSAKMVELKPLVAGLEDRGGLARALERGELGAGGLSWCATSSCSCIKDLV